MLRGQKGITLVALVVTIIVLIILASVSISLLLGQYGVITKAQEGAQNMQAAAGAENNMLAYVDQFVENTISNITGTTTPAGE